ncbi:hypothetical protein AgCh_005330 [Apium graveolens]
MNRTKLPIRKRLGDVPQFSRSIDAAVAEGNGTRDNPDPRPRIWGCYTRYGPNNAASNQTGDVSDDWAVDMWSARGGILLFGLAQKKDGPHAAKKMLRCSLNTAQMEEALSCGMIV